MELSLRGIVGPRYGLARGFCVRNDVLGRAREELDESSYRNADGSVCLRHLLSELLSLGSVLTQRNDNGRTGCCIQTNLNQSTFRRGWGLVGTLPVQGAIYAQPLYVAHLLIGRKTHNVVFIATALNNVYAFDADTLKQLWMSPLDTTPGKLDDTDMRPPFFGNPCAKLSPAVVLDSGKVDIFGIGIQATPVINRGTHTMYVSYRTLDDQDQPHQRLAALDIRTGANLNEVEISEPHFYLPYHRNRASLLLLDQVIYVAFGSRCEDKLSEGLFEYRGWVFAYDARTLKQVGFYTTTTEPHGKEGGIWQASNGLAADVDGSIYLITGNGTFSYDDQYPEGDGRNLGDSFVRLKTQITRHPNDGTISKVDITPVDWFTPYRQLWMNSRDLDLGSCGPVLIPGTRYLMGGGKQGIMYVLNRDDMGKFDTAHAWNQGMVDVSLRGGTSTQWPESYVVEKGRVVQKFQAGENQYSPYKENGLPMYDWAPWPHIHGSPVYADFNNGRSMMYVWPEKDYLKAFERNGDHFDQVGQGGIPAPFDPPTKAGMPGGILSISIDPNRTGGGVVFASVPQEAHGDVLHGSLYAFDPMTLQKLWGNTNDPPYFFAKFCPPTIANRKVFLPTFSYKVLVYGET